MTQSMISLVVGLAVLLAVAFVFVRRYMRAHPGESMTQWLDAHHMGCMHHKH
jgi:energy-converting hydrogenase Eha subunit G